MTESSKPWNGTTVGDAALEAPYDAPTEFAEILMSLADSYRRTNRGGVFNDELSELAPSGGSGFVNISAGRALVYGTWYENDSGSSVTIPTPGSATRIDRIVLRKSWTAQTVRVTRIVGTEGGGVPALTQSAGVTWDLPIAQVSITTAGVITVTDERDFLNSGGGGRRLYDDVPSSGATSVTLTSAPTGDVMVFIGGILQSEGAGDYAHTAGSTSVTGLDGSVINGVIRVQVWG